MLSLVKDAVDILKTLMDMKSDAETNSKIIALNQIILQIQQQLSEKQDENMRLQEKIKQLDCQIANLTNWDTEKEKYTVFQYPTGAIVYRPKEEGVIYDLCATCFHNGRKTILQNNGFANRTCPTCGEEIFTEEPTGGYF